MYHKRVTLSPAAVALVALLLALTLCLFGCGGGNGQPPENAERLSPWEETTAPEAKERTPADSDEERPSPDNGTKEQEAPREVTDAALAALKANNPELPELRVLDVKVVGDWARVDVEPVDGSTDAAGVFLKKTGGTWSVFDFGTGITPENHPEAPPELFR